MKTRLVVGICLIISGLIIFTTALSFVEFEHTAIGSNEMKPIPNLVLYNKSAILIGIPSLLVGIAFVMGNFISKFSKLHIIILFSIIFVTVWVLFIFSRGS